MPQSLEEIIKRFALLLPQAVWYQIEFPATGAILLDSFVTRDSQLFQGTDQTHFRLLILESPTNHSWEQLRAHHKQTSMRVLTQLPPPPPNTHVLAHVCCHSEQHVDHAYGTLREAAENISRKLRWFISDISVTRPSIRKTDLLDTPYYKLFNRSYSRDELKKKPFMLRVQEQGERLKFSTFSLSNYLILIMIPVLLGLLALNASVYKDWHPLLLLLVNALVVCVSGVAFRTEQQLSVDLDGVEYHNSRVLFWFLRNTQQREFLSWDEIEEINTMNLNRGRALPSRLSILADNGMINYQSTRVGWIWQRMMVWLSEHKDRIEAIST